MRTSREFGGNFKIQKNPKPLQNQLWMVNLNSSMYYLKDFFKDIFYTRDGPLQKASLTSRTLCSGVSRYEIEICGASVNQQHAIGYDSIVDEPQLSRH